MNQSYSYLKKNSVGRRSVTSLLFVLSLLFSSVVFGHNVTGYTTACNTGPVYSIDANVTNVNTGTNYAWQYKNTAGNWVCIVNGNNTINGVVYNVSGALSTLTTNPAPIVFNNPTGALQGLVIRCVMSDGAGVNPCNVPAGNTWNSDAASVNFTINVTSTPCGVIPCTGRITNVYFNKLDGGADLPITPGANFTPAQLGSLYNLEAATTGTVGSVVYTITGPTASSNTENTAPYNSPATGSGAWTGANGIYTVNLKVYSGSGATGTICDDTTFTFTVNASNCNCPGNILTNPSFENGVTGWTKSGGNFYTGTAFAQCGNNHGEFQWTGPGYGGFWQDFTTIAVGSTVTINVYAGVHTAANDSWVALEFYNSAGTMIGQDRKQVDAILPTMQYYTMSGVVPAGTTRVRATGYTNGGYLKTDGWCMTVVTPTTVNLGNRVWYDTNNDGINQSGENGIANITVRLYKDDNNDNVADGAAIATTTTNGTGYYSFNSLAPGNYIVGVVVPNGYVSSSVNGGDPDNNTDLDDNGQVVAGNEIRGLAITLTTTGEPEGNTNNTYDFGLLPDCGCTNSTSNLLVNPSFENGTTGWSWSGGTLTTGTGYIACGAANGFNNWSSGTSKVWQDVNVAAGSVVNFSAFAGVHTAGLSCTPRLSLVFLNASNGVISQLDAVVTRDVDVNFNQLEQYSLSGVAPAGTVKVRVQSTINCDYMKLDAFCLTVTIPPASLGDRVWKDDNQNGIQDAGEVGVAGVTVVLYNSTGQIMGTTTTDAFGFYKFSNLTPGDYTVRIVPPANYTLSPKDQGADDNADSDFDPVSYTTGTVTLTPGQNRTDVDAGLRFNQSVPASVGDRVWLDLNNDGVQDAGEPGVSNVLVTLYNSAGVAVANVYTDANGLYLFTNVAPGNYTVGVSLPPAMTFSPNNGVVSNATNSDIVPATGRTASFTVNAGDQIRYVDAGLRPQSSGNASVGDYVWNDLNKDGVQDAGEPGIAGVTVRLVNATTNAVVATTVTDVNGYYIFNEVVPGNYLVEFVTPAGYTVTARNNTYAPLSETDSDVNPANGRTSSFLVKSGDRITSIDAGYWVTTAPGTAQLGDRVWYDANQNGIQDAGEQNVSGVTVTLYNSGGTAIKTTSTDQNGNYLFTDLAAGTYSVGFSNLPAGYTFTTPGLGTAATGSDANPATGRTASVTLVAAQVNLDVDAGIVSVAAGTASLGNRVWYDLNNNGLQDAGEVGVQGVTVELLDAAGNAVDKDPNTAGVQPTTTTTNALGEYLFTGLNAGEYRVRFSALPAGYAVVAKNAGTDRNLDSDGNAIAAGTSTTDVISLAVNQERLDIDLGIFNSTAALGQLGDRVWFDANGNGTQDGTEAGVPGVSVALLNASGTVVATTVTDKDGLYRFVNLANGTYSVRFSNLPAGFSFTGKDLGGNDANDSDADPVTGTTGTYTISGNTDLTADAGLVSTRAALGDYVWFDANSNGTQDPTEKGIAGITVILYDNTGTAVTSTVTDQNGRYFFSNLNPGTYTVGFSTIPDKLVFTTKDVVAAGDAADSDADPATGKTGSYTLAAGQVNLTVDAGLKPLVTASVGDFVWFDLNRDGLQDVDEPGVPGVIATLYNAANQPVGSAVTDGNGYYLISNVPAGTGYYVKFSNQPDINAPWTVQNVGGVAATNNSKADANGQTTTFSVAEGQQVTNVDAGLIRIINLSGNVWHDVNAMSDGLVNNSGAAAIPPAVAIPVGLRVYLVNNSTGLVEQVAFVNPATGTFSFSDINPNTVYSVLLSSSQGVIGSQPPAQLLPSGWENTGQKNANPPNSPVGNDGLNDGKVIVPVGTSDVININFGIRIKGGDVVLG